jgi:hypothetical protein
MNTVNVRLAYHAVDRCRALYQDYHHRDFEWDVTMHGPVIGTAVRF